MKEQSISFTPEMVQAVLAGKKTQTRRPVKPQPQLVSGSGCNYLNISEKGVLFPGVKDIENPEHPQRHSKYKVGDLLWVREPWQHAFCLDYNDQPIEGTARYYYKASPEDIPFTHWVDDSGIYRDEVPWRSSGHMPKEAARIWLRVTNVRVERLKTISMKDMIAEGYPHPIILENDSIFSPGLCIMEWFTSMWDSIYKDKGFGVDRNPWVWVYEFERIEK